MNDLRRFIAACALALICSFAAVPVVAAEPSPIQQVTAGEGSLSYSAGESQVRIQLCQPNLLKVTVSNDRKQGVDTPSIAKIKWAPVAATIDLKSDPIVIRTDRMTANVSRANGHVSIFDAKDVLLIKESDDEGVYQTWQKGVHFSTRAGSHFYGIRGWEYLDDSRGEMEMLPSAQPRPIRAGSEGYTGGPFLWSNLGYGIFVNTEGGFCHVASDTDVRFYDLTGPTVTYYIAVGTAYEVQSAIAELTGKPPMFPKWAMGFSNSEFKDMNEELCAANVEGYRSRGIPIDLYTFDFQWKAWGDDNYGEFRWSPVNFPNGPSGVFEKRMQAAGIKLAGIMKPRIHVDSEEGRYATEHHFWVKNRLPYEDYFSHRLTNDLNFSIPECRAWFWQHSQAAFDSGIVGWWNDEADAWGSTWEFMYMAQAQYEGQRAHTHDQVRVWTNNRNFFSGSQRYGYATWSGDIESGFSVMQQQRERLMCSVNVGQARWGMDTGGFNNNYHISGDELNECFARWMEFAAFVPIFRTHGTSYRQPWLYGPRAEAAARKAARLRYSLIPYIYAYDRRLHETGVGIVRPLVWNYPDDPHLANRVDEWMFGDSLLVAPVVDRGQTVKEIYLPRGEWIDYFRGIHLQGGQTLRYAVDKDTWLDIPLFIKNGAIIPSMEVQNYVGERPVTAIDVDVFPAEEETSFIYYEDDGISYAYEKSDYFKQELRAWITPQGETTVTVSEKIGQFSPALKWYTFKIHAKAGDPILIDDKPAAHVRTREELQSTEAEGVTLGSDIYGPAAYVKVRAGEAHKIVLSGAPSSVR